MGNDNFYDRLLSLPLFQGLSRDEFMEIAAYVRWAFSKKTSGETIVEQDAACQNLIFILKGEYKIIKSSHSKDYELHEWMNNPSVIQPEALFGLNVRYTRTVVAESDVQLLCIEKNTVLKILMNCMTVRINFLNMLSSRVQNSERLLWKNNPDEIKQRFVHFLAERCIRPAGKKLLRIDMVVLGEELMATRLNVSKMLNALEQQQLVHLHRSRVEIPFFEKLLISV